jgi:putative ABC transport system permease protein
LPAILSCDELTSWTDERPIEVLLQDLRFAIRVLRKNPSLTILAACTLGLAIGASSAMFSVINGVLLRPLPFPYSERLVNLWETDLVRNMPRFSAAPANYYDWRKQNQVFVAIGAYQATSFSLATKEGEPERYTGAICDRGFFDVLGIAPAIGRVFTEDEEAAGRDGEIVLSYSVWQQRFGGDPKVVGATLTIDGKQKTVIGVMPEGFSYPPLATMWAPLGFDQEMHDRRDLHRLRGIARLKDGVTFEKARADLATIGSNLAKAYPFFNKDYGVEVADMLEDTVAQLRGALLILLGAVAMVLLIACANVANLLLAKAAGRQREIAIRSSLGASRGRVVQQVLTESLLLSLLGGALGVGFGYAIFRGLLRLAPANLPRLTEVTLDERALLFTLLVSVLTGVLFGMAPAWHASRIDVNPLLKEGSRGTGGRNAFRSILTVAQVTAALILLSGAGLLLHSFYEIERVDSGFDPERAMTMRLVPALFKYRGHPDAQVQLARNILDRVATIPGVMKVGIASDLPLAGNPIFIMRFEGRPTPTPSDAPLANYFAVTPGFFEAMGMRIVRGRALADRDDAGSPLVVVVNQTLVERYFPGQDPIGKRLEIGFSQPPKWREIIGVVADVHSAGLDQDTPVQAYVAYYQQPTMIGFGVPAGMTVVARTATDPAGLGAAMKSAIFRVDRAQPVYAAQPLTTIVAQSIAQRRFSLVLLAVFAATAMFLASLGLYGVLSYIVTQRVQEIGIRMALGARPGQVVVLIETQAMRLVLTGLILGVVGELVLTRFMTSMLFRVRPSDPFAMIASGGVLLVVSLVASYVPARRAAQVDPLIALRHE